MRAVYPGSFNPPTVGHIAIVNSAIKCFDIHEIHLTISSVALGKEKLVVPSVADRIEALERSFRPIPEASVMETPKQLIADIAEGYDLVILGALTNGCNCRICLSIETKRTWRNVCGVYLD